MTDLKEEVKSPKWALGLQDSWCHTDKSMALYILNDDLQAMVRLGLLPVCAFDRDSRNEAAMRFATYVRTVRPQSFANAFESLLPTLTTILSNADNPIREALTFEIDKLRDTGRASQPVLDMLRSLCLLRLLNVEIADEQANRFWFFLWNRYGDLSLGADATHSSNVGVA